MKNNVIKDDLNYSAGYYQTKHSLTKGMVVVFVQRIVVVVAVGAGAILFPITAIIVAAKSFYKSRNQGLDLPTRLRGALATAVFPLVIIGPVLFYKLSKNNTIKGMSMLSEEVDGPKTMKDYCIISIPFFSSFVVSLNIICPSYPEKLRKLLEYGSSFFNKEAFIDYSISTIMMLAKFYGVTSQELENFSEIQQSRSYFGKMSESRNSSHVTSCLNLASTDLNHPTLRSLDDTEALLEWSEIERLLSSIDASNIDCTSYSRQTLFRALLIGVWYRLSDVQLAQCLYRDLLFRKFCHLELDGEVPEASSLERFRARLVEHHLWDQLLANIDRQLVVKNIIIKEGCINIINATWIKVSQSGSDNDKGEKTTKVPDAD